MKNKTSHIIRSIVLLPLSVAVTTALYGCGEEGNTSTENVQTKNSQVPASDTRPSCKAMGEADVTFTFNVNGFSGNPVNDAIVCVTPDRNSSNCSGSILSMRTNILGQAKLRLSHEILRDYRINVQSPLYGGYDVFNPDELLEGERKRSGSNTNASSAANSSSVVKDASSTSSSMTSLPSEINIKVDPTEDLLRLGMRYINETPEQVAGILAETMGTSLEHFEVLRRQNTAEGLLLTRVLGALNLPQRRLNRVILLDYIRGMIPTLARLRTEGIPDHQIVLAVKRKSSRAEFPSVDEIRGEAAKNKNLRPPLTDRGTYSEQLLKGTMARAVRVSGQNFHLSPRIGLDANADSTRSKREGSCNPKTLNDNENNIIWLFPDGQRSNGKNVTAKYGGDDTGAVIIDNIGCVNDSFGRICAEDELFGITYNEKVITDALLKRYVNSFGFSHRLVQRLPDGSTVVEFNIAADLNVPSGVESLFTVEIIPGDNTGRRIYVPIKNGQGQVLHIYPPELRSARAILNVNSLVTNSIDGSRFNKVDTDFVTLASQSAMPVGTKLIAVQSGGCGRDRSLYYFRLENPYRPHFASELRNSRLTWNLGAVTKTSTSADAAVPIEVGSTDFKRASSLWDRYSVTVRVGRESFIYKLSEVKDRGAGVCGPLDTMKLRVGSIKENGFTAEAGYDYFDAWDSLTTTKWYVNGVEQKGTGSNDRRLEVSDLSCGSIVNLVAEGQLSGRTHRIENNVTLEACGSERNEVVVAWLSSLKLRTAVGGNGTILFQLAPSGTDGKSTPSAKQLEEVTFEVDYGDGFSEIMPYSTSFSHEYLAPGAHGVSVHIYYGGKAIELSADVPSIDKRY